MIVASRLLAAIFILGALTACSEDHGPVEVQARKLGAFNAVDVEGAASLQIAIGSPASVELEGGANVLDRIDTEVRDETLYIRTRVRDWFIREGQPRTTVRITLPRLNSLRLGGGYEASLVGFAGGESHVKVEGAVKIKASGHLDQLTLHLAGASTANLSELTAANARVSVDGVGRVVVHATETLDATMNGMGAIHYIGNPREVRTRMNGLGTIGRQDSEQGEPESESKPELDPEKLQPEYDEAAQWKKGGETEVI